jgi:hypothetical protein
MDLFVQISFCAVLGDKRHVTAFNATKGRGINSQLRVYLPHAATCYELGEAQFYSLAGFSLHDSGLIQSGTASSTQCTQGY